LSITFLFSGLEANGDRLIRWKVLAGFSGSNSSYSFFEGAGSDFQKGPLLKPVFGAGVVIGKQLSVEADLLYFQKGAVYTVGYYDVYGTTRHTYRVYLNEISLSLLGKFNVLPSSASPYALFGVEFARILSNKASYHWESDMDSGGETFDFMDITNKSDQGIVIGVGGDLDFGGPLAAFCEIRYYFGGANLSKDSQESITSNAVVFCLGFKF
jgi:hypothetical protein